MTKFPYTIKDFSHTILDRGLIRSDMHEAHTAIITFENGDWMGVSRYHDEEHWIVDCAFRANGFPVFSNGTGSRCTMVSAMSDEDAEDLNALL